MDPELLRERDLFKKRSLSTPVVENRKRKESDPSPSGSRPDAKKKPKPAGAPSAGPTQLDAKSYKNMTGTSQHKFAVLAKIVNYLRARYQEGDVHPLSIDEILDETNQLDVSARNKAWLMSEALVNNPKVEVSEDMKFTFKPPYRLKDKKSLLRLLKQHDLKGLGGIALDDIMESLPHAEKALKSLQSEIIYVVRPNDKKKILFYKDKTADITVDEEFKKLWRAVAVDSLDDKKIADYLEKQGIRSMQDHGIKKPKQVMKRKKGMRKKTGQRIKDNEHLAEILENYDEV